MRLQPATGSRRTDAPEKAKAMAKARVLSLSGLFCILPLLFTGAGQFPQTAPPPPAPPEAIQKLLDDAIGFASVYNYKKTEDLCDRVLAMTTQSQILAQAHWIKAVAYAYFQVEYGTQDLMGKLAAEREMVRQLRPDLLMNQLPHLEAHLLFCLAEKPDIEAILDKTRRALLPPELVEKAKTTSVEDLLSNPLSICKLGHVYWAAAEMTEGSSQSKSPDYYEKARKILKIVAQREPDEYEHPAYYLTVLAEMGLKIEAEKVGEDILARFDGKLRYPFCGDHGPFCLYAAAVGQSDPTKARRMIEERAGTAAADAWVHYYSAVYRQGRVPSVAEKARILAELVQRMESGGIQTPGTYLCALAGVYDRLAHLQCNAGQLEQSLATCKKLADISPHYFEIHNLKGIVYKALASKEKDPEKAKALLGEARKEFELQIQFDWRGRGAFARRQIEQLGKEQTKQPPKD